MFLLNIVLVIGGVLIKDFGKRHNAFVAEAFGLGLYVFSLLIIVARI
ncbi:MAG TPA: hypothetical protein VMV38_00620 [Candidatus Paceibacterota bacterium]|nr:hypothetical protein [Candidatus Paceibacterota bacterium]